MNPVFTIEIPAYGLMVIIGIMSALAICSARIDKYNYNYRILLVISVIVLIGMALGAKILFFITQIPLLIEEFTFEKLIKTFITSGFVFYGGLIGAIIFAQLAARLLNIEKNKLLSFLAPSFVIFHAFGRIGCFLAGCCYGIPWKYGIAMANDPSTNRFPVQLAEATVEIIIFIVLMAIERRKFGCYNLMKIYICCYAVARFCLEFLRGDEIRGLWIMGLSTSQIISVIILITCVIHTYIAHIKKRDSCRGAL